MVLHFFVLLLVCFVGGRVGAVAGFASLCINQLFFFFTPVFLISDYQKKKEVYFETSCIRSTPGLMQQTKTKIITLKKFLLISLRYFFNQFTPPRFTLSITGKNRPCLIKSYVSPGLYYITSRCLLNLHNRDLSKIKYFF